MTSLRMFTLPGYVTAPGPGAIDLRVVALCSLLISLWLALVTPADFDGSIIYLRAAQAYLQQDFAASLATFERPGFSLAMAWLHQFTGISLATAALLLSSLLYLLLCLVFVHTVHVLGGNKRTQLIAAVSVLCLPLLCDYRSPPSREVGYWAFTLLGLQQLLHYCRWPHWPRVFKWLVCMVIAAAFRLEALLLAALVPISLLAALPVRQRWTAGTRLVLPTWLLIGLAYLTGLVPPLANPETSLFPAHAGYWLDLLDTDNHLRALAVTAVEQQQATWMLVGGLLGLLAFSLLRGMGFAYLLLLLTGLWRGSVKRVPKAARTIITAFFGSGVLLLGLHLFATADLHPADAGVLVLMLLLYLPFCAEELWEIASPLSRSLLLLLAAAVCTTALYNNNFSDRHIAQAANWIHLNTAADSTLLSNSAHIAWASGQRVDQNTGADTALQEVLASGLWQQYRYLAFVQPRDTFSALLGLAGRPQLALLARFSNSNSDWVIILENMNFRENP